MFKRRSGAAGRGENEGDERLSALLHEWKEMEPRANFEADVRRRIRAASMPSRLGLVVLTVLREWLVPRPAWVSAAAAAAGVVAGVGLAFSAPAARDGRQTPEPLMSSKALAGSYLALATGGTR